MILSFDYRHKCQRQCSQRSASFKSKAGKSSCILVSVIFSTISTKKDIQPLSIITVYMYVDIAPCYPHGLIDIINIIYPPFNSEGHRSQCNHHFIYFNNCDLASIDLHWNENTNLVALNLIVCLILTVLYYYFVLNDID